MANPRKFSEKIALHNQKQAEETAAFERIMQEVSVTRHPPQRMLSPHSPFLRQSLGGSLPNVNQMSNPPMEMQMRQSPYDEFKPPHYRHQLRFDTRPRPYDPNRRPDLQNRHPRHIGIPGSPHCGSYLSPPADTSWRSSFGLSRTHSDSALHQSVMNPNSQETYIPLDHQPHMNPVMPPPHSREKLQQQLVGVTRPKSCEESPMNVLPNDANHRLGMPPNPQNPGLSHITQIANNTGSLPDLTNLHIPSPLSNPIDYDEQQKQASQNHHASGSLQTPASMLYNQARSTGNIPAESAHNPQIGGLSSRGNPASPSRSRRHTHNGPSPLSITSPDQNRRLKFHGGNPAKIGVKPDMKSSPIGGSYPYPYSMQGPVHQEIRHHLQHTPNNTHPILRVDVNAASKVAQYPHNHSLPSHRQSAGQNLSSPITSPTSPISQNSFSPASSPQHLPELTSGNPALSEAYYRPEVPSMQPLQHEFEQFHFVNDSSMLQTSGCSNLQLLSESSYPQNSVFGAQRNSDSSIYPYNGSHLLYKNLISPTAKIPDIVFTSVDDGQSSRAIVEESSNLYSGTDLTSDYFPGDDLKSNFGIEELQMLAQDKLIEDPVLEDELRLNTT